MRILCALLLASAGSLGCGDAFVDCGEEAPPVLSMPVLAEDEPNVWVDNVYVPLDYADMASTPTGKAHLGIHYSPRPGNAVGASYYAMADGTISVIEPVEQSGEYMTIIQHSMRGGVVVVYQFETLSTNPDHGAAQVDAIAVTERQEVRMGDLIGALIDHDGAGEARPMMHIGVIDCEGNLICPSLYMSPEAIATTERMLAADFPGTQICYEN